MSKRMKIIFWVSLVLNALMIGIFAGHIIRIRQVQPLHRARDIRPEMRSSVNQQRVMLFKIMGAPTFDAPAFQVQLDRYSDAYCDFNKKFMIDLNARLQQLPPHERARVMHQIMRPRRR